MSLVERALSLLLGPRVDPPPDLPPGSLPEGVVLRRGRLVPRIGGLLAGMGGPAAAVTLRRTIVLSPHARLTEPLLVHELTHVRQWEGDPLFPVRYTLATVRHGYRDNPFEIEARQVASAFPRTPNVEDVT